MKGFPRRGSDRPSSSRLVSWATSLNEGLPQKGKRWGGGADDELAGDGASMKGFPRRGSDGMFIGPPYRAFTPQ